MSITVRSYEKPRDYEKIGQFLIDTYRPGTRHENWLQPRWEYMHYHPLLEELGESADDIHITMEQHMEILKAMEQKDVEKTLLLLREHLTRASRSLVSAIYDRQHEIQTRDSKLNSKDVSIGG